MCGGARGEGTGFSSEIETARILASGVAQLRVARELASHLRLKPENPPPTFAEFDVARELASHLRLKQRSRGWGILRHYRGEGTGFSSEIETKGKSGSVHTKRKSPRN